MTAPQPMDTAPRDGRRVIVWRAGRWGFARWSNGNGMVRPRPCWLDAVEGRNWSCANPPTHWLPEPASPEAGL